MARVNIDILGISELKWTRMGELNSDDHYIYYGQESLRRNGVALIGEGNGTPLQYSCLGNLMDGGAWWAAVHGVMKSRTRLSDFTFTFHFQALEKEMATHSTVLAWKIPGTGEPGGLLSMGSHRVGHDWSDLAAAAAALIVNERVQNAVLGWNLQNNKMISVHFQDKPFNITVIQVHSPTTNAKKLKLNSSLKTYKAF